MTGRGKYPAQQQELSAANVDRSRSGQNVTFFNEDLKKVYHELFDEALAAYNAKKKKTQDKIPDYYEHIRRANRRSYFTRAIFQIGNLTDCGCGSPGGERAAGSSQRICRVLPGAQPSSAGCSIWCCTWTRPRPTSMWTSCRWQRSRAGAFRRGYQ